MFLQFFADKLGPDRNQSIIAEFVGCFPGFSSVNEMKKILLSDQDLSITGIFQSLCICRELSLIDTLSCTACFLLFLGADA